MSKILRQRFCHLLASSLMRVVLVKIKNNPKTRSIKNALTLSFHNNSNSFFNVRFPMFYHIQLASGRTGFNVKNTNIYLTGGSTGTNISGLKSKARITDILEVANKAPDDGFVLTGAKPKKKSVAERTDYEILPITLLLKMTKDSTPDDLVGDESKYEDDNEAKHGDQTEAAFALDIDSEQQRLHIPLIVDSLAILHRNTEAVALYDILIEGLCRSIRLIECSCVEQKFLSRLDEAGVPKTYSFLPNDLGHFFSCVYFTCTTDDDEQAKRYRKRLHHHFGLSVQRPHFRKANQLSNKEEKCLVNPHEAIKNQGESS